MDLIDPSSRHDTKTYKDFATLQRLRPQLRTGVGGRRHDKGYRSGVDYPFRSWLNFFSMRLSQVIDGYWYGLSFFAIDVNHPSKHKH